MSRKLTSALAAAAMLVSAIPSFAGDAGQNAALAPAPAAGLKQASLITPTVGLIIGGVAAGLFVLAIVNAGSSGNDTANSPSVVTTTAT